MLYNEPLNAVIAFWDSKRFAKIKYVKRVLFITTILMSWTQIIVAVYNDILSTSIRAITRKKQSGNAPTRRLSPVNMCENLPRTIDAAACFHSATSAFGWLHKSRIKFWSNLIHSNGVKVYKHMSWKMISSASCHLFNVYISE